MRWDEAYRFRSDPPNDTVTGCADDAHDMQQLILVVPATEKRHATNHFREYTTAGPYIDRGAVGP